MRSIRAILGHKRPVELYIIVSKRNHYDGHLRISMYYSNDPLLVGTSTFIFNMNLTFGNSFKMA